MSEFHRICLVGFDRVVGSFGLGLKRIGFRGSIVGVADKALLTKSWKLGIISDGYEELEPALKNADLIVLSTDIGHSVNRLEQVLKLAAEQAVISETTHIKGEIHRVFTESARTDLHYVGFRLLGEREEISDIEHANKFFFEGRWVILTPRGKDDLEAYSGLSGLLEKMGAKCIAMSPQAHDRALADMQQVPQMCVLAILQNLFGSQAVVKATPEMLGNWIMSEVKKLQHLRSSGWVDEIEANKQMVLESIDILTSKLQQMKSDLREGKLAMEFDELMSRTAEISLSEDGKESTDLVIVAGNNSKTIERIAELLANARIAVENLDRMQHADTGTYRLTLKTSLERDNALSLIRSAGIEAVNLP
jgi:prephenate dehydrogenase